MWGGIITSIKDLAKDIKDFKKEEKESLGELFEITSALLLEVIMKFEEDEYPQTLCATVETLGNNIAKNMTRVIKKKKREEILEYFEPFKSLQDEWDKRKDPETIDGMKYAAGEFKGLSILFKT